MSAQHDQLTRLQTALAQLSAPAFTSNLLFPGPERYSMIYFLLQKLLTPEMVSALQQRYMDSGLPSGISAEEAQAHCFAWILQSIDFQATVDQVRGCTDDSLRLLASLASLAAAHQRFTREAVTASANRAPSPMANLAVMGNPASVSTPRQRTPNRSSSIGGWVGYMSNGPPGARPLLSLQSLDSEIRLLDGLAERLPQLLDPGGGGNWFPSDILAALQPYMQGQSMADVAATVEQQGWRARAELPALHAEEARLAAEVTVVDEAEWQQQAEATRQELANLLETSSGFYHTFQTGLGVWCAASRDADTCGLGPMASEFLQRYEQLRRLGADLARIRQAHTSIASCAPPITLLEHHTLSQLVRVAQATVEQRQARLTVQQRLLEEADEAAKKAAASIRAATQAQS